MTALLRVNSVRRALLRRLPRRFRQEDRLDRIERDVKAIKAHLGVVECHADLKNGKTVPQLTNGQQKKSSSPLAAYVRAIIARYFTRSKVIYPSQQRRMNMKSKLLSRKFLMAVISAALVVANDGLNLGLDQNTILAFGSIVVGWIVSETVVDVSNTPKAGVASYDAKALDTVRSDSEDAKYTASN
jgi:hypothetical protein